MEDKTPKEIYNFYKKRWSIETFYNYISRDQTGLLETRMVKANKRHGKRTVCNCLKKQIVVFSLVLFCPKRVFERKLFVEHWMGHLDGQRVWLPRNAQWKMLWLLEHPAAVHERGWEGRESAGERFDTEKENALILETMGM